jgi:hypothetical protein
MAQHGQAGVSGYVEGTNRLILNRCERLFVKKDVEQPLKLVL